LSPLAGEEGGLLIGRLITPDDQGWGDHKDRPYEAIATLGKTMDVCAISVGANLVFARSAWIISVAGGSETRPFEHIEESLP